MASDEGSERESRGEILEYAVCHICCPSEAMILCEFCTTRFLKLTLKVNLEHPTRTRWQNDMEIT